ncbi:MAG: sialidase family protein, partial [Bryobacteraceae bacterium]
MATSALFIACCADFGSVDPALDAPQLQTSPGPEYAAANRKFQGIPGIERARNGRLWAVWYAGDTREGPQNYVLLVTSGDDGKTWTDARLVIDPPGFVRAFDACIW